MVTRLTPQPVKQFTRDDPCTKVELWNCFASAKGFRKRAVVEARGIIGVNAIKYLLREGYAIHEEMGGVEYWELTPDGEEWLTKGALRYVELHPETSRLFRPPLPGQATPVRRIMRRRV